MTPIVPLFATHMLSKLPGGATICVSYDNNIDNVTTPRVKDIQAYIVDALNKSDGGHITHIHWRRGKIEILLFSRKREPFKWVMKKFEEDLILDKGDIISGFLKELEEGWEGLADNPEFKELVHKHFWDKII